MKTVQRYERHSRLGQSWEALPERVRIHLLRCDEQLVAVLRDDPHTRLIWDLLDFAERSPAWHLSARAPDKWVLELRRQWITARMWITEDLKSSSALRTLARESKNGRLRAAFVTPHVSEESSSDQCSVRLLWTCGQGPLSCGHVAVKMRLCPKVDVHKLPLSRREQHGATVILSSQVDPTDLHGTKFFGYSSLRSKMSQETPLWTLDVSGTLLGRRLLFGTGLDKEVHVSHAADTIQLAHLCSPSK